MAQKRIALVTGRSWGIGKDIALSIAKKDVDVTFTYHSKRTTAEEVVKKFYASNKEVLTGPLIDQSSIFPSLSNHAYQDNANEAIYRFIN